MRVGIGYDIHRLSPGRPLVLGGVALPSEVGLEGHSDADVLLHAVTDALLGAIGAPDIGELFPSDDARLHNADSRIFLEEALRRLAAAGMSLANLDAVIIAQRPKLVPHKEAIKQSLARLLNVAVEQVNVKAKTTEGFPPADQGIAAQAVVLVK